MKRRFGRQTSTESPRVRPRPPEAAGWVGRVYGAHAAELITDLANMMRAADDEAMVPRTQEPSLEHAGTDRQSLTDHLVELRNVMVAVDVSEDDSDRDVHLRAALSAAIGAASGLASASHSQPTKGYLSVVKPAVDHVLIAAGEPIVS